MLSTIIRRWYAFIQFGGDLAQSIWNGQQLIYAQNEYKRLTNIEKNVKKYLPVVWIYFYSHMCNISVLMTRLFPGEKNRLDF